jgi:hypothetical protein
MAHMFPEGHPWFAVSQHPFLNGTFAKLRRSAQGVYAALLYEVQRKSSRHITADDARLKELTSVSEPTLRDVRKNLLEHGLFSCKRTGYGKYRYTLLDPATSSEFVMVPRRRPPERDTKTGTSPFNEVKGVPLNFERD